MPCTHVPLEGGGHAIVCTKLKRCKCGRRATLLCDWKMPNKKSGTCDAPICDQCTTRPARNKDLCTKHALAYNEWRRTREPNP